MQPSEDNIVFIFVIYKKTEILHNVSFLVRNLISNNIPASLC